MHWEASGWIPPESTGTALAAHDDRRDRQLGAGYDYQWDIATYLLLVHCLKPNRSAQRGLYETINRAALRLQPGVDRRAVFVTNGEFHDDVSELVADPSKLGELYDHLSNRMDNLGTRAAFVAAGQTMYACPFLRASPVSSGTPPVGVRGAIVAYLDEQRAPDPEDAYIRIRHHVMGWSFRKGGTHLTGSELRAQIRELLNLPTASMHASGVVDYVEYLRRVDPQGDHIPSWSQLDAGDVWFADPALDAAMELLERDGNVVITGGQGSGKTVVVRMMVHRLHAAGYAVAAWDFEHWGRDLPSAPPAFWRSAVAHATFDGLKPLVVLENVHHPPRGVSGAARCARPYPRRYSASGEVDRDLESRVSRIVEQLPARARCRRCGSRVAAARVVADKRSLASPRRHGHR